MSVKNITRRKFIELMGIGVGVAGTTQFIPFGNTLLEAKAAVKKIPPDQLMRQKLAQTTIDCSKYKKDPPWKLAFVTQGKTNSWVVMFDAHVDYAVQVKYKGLFKDFFYGDSQGNAERQLDVYEDALVLRPDVMLLAPMGQAAISASVDETAKMSIPVIYNSSRAESDNFVTWVEASNYRQGAVFAEWLAKKMNYKGKYIALSGIAGLSVCEDRLRGARDASAWGCRAAAAPSHGDRRTDMHRR